MDHGFWLDRRVDGREDSALFYWPETWQLGFQQKSITAGALACQCVRNLDGSKRAPAFDSAQIEATLRRAAASEALAASEAAYRSAAAFGREHGYVVDPTTGFSWPAATSEAAVTFQESGAFCRRLAIGGLDDWRLPTFEQLEGLLVPAAARGTVYHGPSGLRVPIQTRDRSVWVLPAALDRPRELSDQVWFYNFYLGRQESRSSDADRPIRLNVLCVR